MKIGYKLILAIISIASIAAVPLSVYVLRKQKTEKIIQTIKYGKSNVRIFARSMVDIYVKSDADLKPARIDAEELTSIFQDQFSLGLVFAQAILLTPKDFGQELARLTKKDNLQGKADNRESAPLGKINKHKLDELKKQGNYQEIKCQIMKGQCFEFLSTGNYLDREVVLTRMLVSKAFILAPLDELEDIIIIVTAATIFIAILIGAFLSRTITTPIKYLMKGASAYASGIFDYKIEVNSKDELGTLASAFNGMAIDIKEKMDEIKDHRSVRHSLK